MVKTLNIFNFPDAPSRVWEGRANRDRFHSFFPNFKGLKVCKMKDFCPPDRRTTEALLFAIFAV